MSCGHSSVVERLVANEKVEGSNPFARSKILMKPKKTIFYLLSFIIVFSIIEFASHILITKLEKHRFVKSIISAHKNNNEDINKIKKKYRDILPYIRDPNKFKNSNDYMVSYDPSHLLYTTINVYSSVRSKNILIQGDSWAERLSSVGAYNYLKKQSNKNNLGLINAGISSYSPSPMSIQLFILRKDFNIFPNTIIAIIDQTDIADEIYRYNTPDWSENKINYFDFEHEEPLVHVFASNNLSIVKLFNISKIFFTAKKKKFNNNNVKTVKYFFQRIKIFMRGIPTVLFPLINGFSESDKLIFTERVKNYIDIVFQDQKMEKLIFVTHPHKNHLADNDKKYKSEIGTVISEIIENSIYKNKIKHIDFYKKDRAPLDDQDINKMFIKDDVYSHLTDEMYVNYYLPYILKNTVKD